IGEAVNAFKATHGGRVSWRTPTPEGGTWSNPKPGNAWFEFYWLSNNLGTPKILACPADAGVRVAPNFTTYAAIGFRAAATSYAIGLDPAVENPRSWVSGDRNI